MPEERCEGMTPERVDDADSDAEEGEEGAGSTSTSEVSGRRRSGSGSTLITVSTRSTDVIAFSTSAERLDKEKGEA